MSELNCNGANDSLVTRANSASAQPPGGICPTSSVRQRRWFPRLIALCLVLALGALAGAISLRVRPAGGEGVVAPRDGQSHNYRITADALSQGGGAGTSASFRVVDTLGDAIETGHSGSTGFRLCSGLACALGDGPAPNTLAIVNPPDRGVTVSDTITVTGVTQPGAQVMIQGDVAYSTVANSAGLFAVPGVDLAMGVTLLEGRSTDPLGRVASASSAVTRTVYLASGTLESRVHDAGSAAQWGALAWQASTPAGAGLAFRTRTGNTAVPDASWSAWSENSTTPGQPISSPAGRYVQYEASFTSIDGRASPTLEEVTLAYTSAIQQTTLSLAPGWNLLALPLTPQTPLAAQALLDAVNAQGAACSEVDRWLNGGWDAHIDGLPFNNFAIEPGKGYFLKCTATGQWTLDGYALSDGVPIALQPGWNLVGLPYPPSGYSAQALLDAVAAQGGACSEVDRWLNGGWDAHIGGLPFNNFGIEPERGYFIRCSQPSVFVPG